MRAHRRLCIMVVRGRAQRVRVRRILTVGRRLVQHVRIAQRGIIVGMVIRCMILCTNVINVCRILVHMGRERGVVIIPVVLEPAQCIMGIVMRGVILIQSRRVMRGIIWPVLGPQTVWM